MLLMALHIFIVGHILDIQAASHLAVGSLTQEGAQLTVALATNVLPNERIPVLCTLYNSSSVDVRYESADATRDFELRVTKEDGNPVEFTARGKRENGPAIVHRTTSSAIQPRKFLQHRYDLAQWFNLTQPGTYHLRVSFQIEDLYPDSWRFEKVVIDDIRFVVQEKKRANQ